MSEQRASVMAASTWARFLAIFMIELAWSATSGFSTLPTTWSVIRSSSAGKLAPHPPSLSKQYQPGGASGLSRGGNFDRLMAAASQSGQVRSAFRYRHLDSWELADPNPSATTPPVSRDTI